MLAPWNPADDADHRLSPERIEALVRAARVERARTLRRALLALFGRRGKDEARREMPVLDLSPCR